MSVFPLITANAGPSRGRVSWPLFSVRVALILVILMSWLVAVSSAPVSNAGSCVDNRDTKLFITKLQLFSIPLKIGGLLSFCSSSTLDATVTLIIRES